MQLREADYVLYAICLRMVLGGGTVLLVFSSLFPVSDRRVVRAYKRHDAKRRYCGFLIVEAYSAISREVAINSFFMRIEHCDSHSKLAFAAANGGGYGITFMDFKCGHNCLCSRSNVAPH